MVRLPSDPRKRYLSGVDWLVHALDHLTRRATGVGNTSQIVLSLDGRLSDAAVAWLADLGRRCPALSGRTRRDYNLAPYWSLLPPDQCPPIRVTRDNASDDGADSIRRLSEPVNRGWTGPREHVAFSVVRGVDHDDLCMAFDHRLFDARGAEAFLGVCQDSWDAGNSAPLPPVTPHPAHLDEWGRKFRAGQQTNRAFIQLGEHAPPRVLPLPAQMRGRPFRFRLLQFDEAESARIVETAQAQAGYLLLLPFTLAASMAALHAEFRTRGIAGRDYIISVTVDMRPPGPVGPAVLFNHLSFVHFRIAADDADDFPRLVGTIRRQFFEQVKNGFSAHLRDAADLMRIAPLPALSRMMGVHFGGQIASCCFSHIGESGFQHPAFLGVPVRNLFHLPRMPVPPGIGLFFTQFRGRLNVVLTYLDGLLEDEAAAAMMTALSARLGL